jgi:hypothetical protein
MKTLFAPLTRWSTVSSSSPSEERANAFSKGHKEPIDTAIIKLSFMSTILEEHGRQFMAAEWYKMKKIGDCIQGGG